MPQTQQPDGLSFHTLTAILRRRWWVLPLFLLVPAAALAFSLSQEEKYSSSAAILFRDVGSVLASEDPEREAATNVGLLGLGAVEKRVERRLGGSGAAADEVTLAQEGQSNLLTIQGTDPDPQRAARTANAYAREYVRFRRQTELRDIENQERFLRSELERIPAFRQPNPRAAELRRQIRRLEFESSTTTGVARIVSSAQPASSPSSPKPMQNTLVAGLVGLFLAGIVALLFERLDPRLRTPKEAEAIFERPILGLVPRSRALSRPVSGRVPARDFDSFLALRTYLRHMRPSGELRSVLVTSGAAGDGKTTVAWNLACAAAAPGARTLLVEADVRAPTLAAALKVQPEAGLGKVLAGDGDLREVAQEVAVESSQNGRTPARIVSVVFAGSSSGAAHHLGWERLGASLAEAEQHFDLIVVDTAPLVSVPDAVPLLSHVDGVIVIGRLDSTPRAALARLREQLDTVAAPTVGVVVNSVGKDAQYGYGYGYEHTAPVEQG